MRLHLRIIYHFRERFSLCGVVAFSMKSRNNFDPSWLTLRSDFHNYKTLSLDGINNFVKDTQCFCETTKASRNMKFHQQRWNTMLQKFILWWGIAWNLTMWKYEHERETNWIEKQFITERKRKVLKAMILQDINNNEPIPPDTRTLRFLYFHVEDKLIKYIFSYLRKLISFPIKRCGAKNIFTRLNSISFSTFIEAKCR